MRLSLACVTLALAILAQAVPHKDFVPKLKESILAPRGWTKQGRARPDDTIDLRIALPQPNFPLLEQNLYEVRFVPSWQSCAHELALTEYHSDPYHERYGQHLTQAEVYELVAPHDESIELVDDWLASYGISDKDFERSPAQDWVKLKIPIGLAEEMLNTVSQPKGFRDAISRQCAKGILHLDSQQRRVHRAHNRVQHPGAPRQTRRTGATDNSLLDSPWHAEHIQVQ